MFEKYSDKAKAYLKKTINDRRKIIKILVIVLILLIALIVKISDSNRQNVSVETNTNEVTEVSDVIYVDISGEVINPGVYEANEGTRLFEIIAKAGGLTVNADKNSINQAKCVEDGEKIIIPTMKVDDNTSYYDQDNGLININTASKEELMELNGVGEAIADRIIEYRETTQFKSIEDIMCVNGIGNATFEKMKSKITV